MQSESYQDASRTYPEFGNLIKEFRESFNLSQGELQNKLVKLDYPIDTTTISKYEHGDRKPPPSFIAYLAKALNLDPEYETFILNTYIEEYRFDVINEYESARKKILKGK